MTKIVGLTGGIGSGKTTVANHFKSLGVPVYIADDAAKEVMGTPEIIAAIEAQFGPAVFTDDEPDKRKLAAVVFNDPQALQKLNNIIHPAVRKHFSEWFLRQHYPYVIREAAILFESGSYKDCDYIITVTAPLETRISRVMLRDNVTRNDVLKRVQNQWTDAMRIAKSDFLIENVDANQTNAKTEEIHAFLLNP